MPKLWAYILLYGGTIAIFTLTDQLFFGGGHWPHLLWFLICGGFTDLVRRICVPDLNQKMINRANRIAREKQLKKQQADAQRRQMQ